jgi:hypothetical protein
MNRAMVAAARQGGQMVDNMRQDAAGAPEPKPVDGPARRPYAAPRIESGEAFERVQLASGCDFGVFDGCETPCDE